MFRLWLAAIVAVVLLLGVTTSNPVMAVADPSRPANPPNRPSIVRPFSAGGVEMTSGAGVGGTHQDDPTKPIKSYYNYDYLLRTSDTGQYVGFPVVASAAGTISKVVDKGILLGEHQDGCPVDVDPNAEGYQGLGAQINHGNGWSTFYFHLADLKKTSGHVEAGEVIGTAGCTGANVIHLHYDLRWFDAATKLTWTYPVDFQPTLPPPTIDLAFAIDTTGSMADDIDSVKAVSADIVDLIKREAPDSRIALTDFRDFSSRTGTSFDYPYRDGLGFTDDGNLAKRAINGLTLGNGGDTPETQNCALMHMMYGDRCAGLGALTSIGVWRNIPGKFVVVLTDAPALSPEPFTGYSTASTATRAKSGGFELIGGPFQQPVSPHSYPIAIYSIVGGGSSQALANAQQLATMTGGKVFSAATSKDTGPAILAAVREIIEPPSPAPNCSTATPNPGMLWPPNGALKEIKIGAVENATSVAITGIRQDEKTDGQTDAKAVGSGVAQVRAQRNGNGDGRVYHILFTASGRGGSCTGEVKVIIPHDMGKGQRERGTAIDGGPIYDSTKP